MLLNEISRLYKHRVKSLFIRTIYFHKLFISNFLTNLSFCLYAPHERCHNVKLKSEQKAKSRWKAH